MGWRHIWVERTNEHGRWLAICGHRHPNPWMEQILRSEQQYRWPLCEGCAAEDAAMRLTGCTFMRCDACAGAGVRAPTPRTEHPEIPRVCPECKGKGYVYTSPADKAWRASGK